MPGKAFDFFKMIGKYSLIGSPIILVALFAFFFLREILLSPADPNAKEPTIIEIAQGTSFRQACKLVESRGVVKHWWTLDIISRIKGKNTIGAGEYELSAAMTPEEILRYLLEGKTFKRKIVLKEGQSIYDLGEIVEAAGLLSRAEINKGLIDAQLLSESGIGVGSFEGYLFPETYLFSRPVQAEDILFTMLSEGKKHWPDEFEKRAKSLNLTKHEVLTLASIIEKESGNSDEQPTIAAVFHNRLRVDWPLQSDPTAVYGLPGFTGPILRKHLAIESAYNTYKIRGLPPGPICNPGDSAIRAALYPENADYMYFVADGRGGHIFSISQKEHERAVEFYRHTLKMQRQEQGLKEEADDEQPAE
ncbi:MAG: endolytic transglycosylase MltG [bacterium]|nr:endolytic transglycosylase MltG [bacterium]